MTSKKVIGICLLLMGVLVGGSAFAEYGSGGKPGPDREHHKKWVEELNLTEAQKQQLHEIRESYRDKMSADRQAMRDAKTKLREALQSDASEADLRNQYMTIQALKKDLSTTRFEKILAIRQILTPEQRKKFKAFHHHRRYKHKP